MTDTASLQARLQRLEDRESIRELVMRYGLVMDDRDIDAMPGLFAADVHVRSLDGMP